MARAYRYVTACGFAVAAIDAPGHGDRPRTEASAENAGESGDLFGPQSSGPAADAGFEDDLLTRARREDALHWQEHQRPISAETLRKRLRIGAARSRMLVAMVRSDGQARRVIDEVEHAKAVKI